MLKHRGNGMEFRGKPMEQLLSRVKKDAKTGCWNWQGALFKGTNYGQFSNRALSKSPTTTHRASWELHFGKIPEGKMVLHGCDNRLCCNPEHLRIGDNADNMRDRSLRGFVHQRKLTEEKVIEMRRLRRKGWSWRKLAVRYNVQTNAVRDATLGRSWAFVTEPTPGPTS
jgi:HNH endonuclease